jgi:hypothetical protein
MRVLVMRHDRQPCAIDAGLVELASREHGGDEPVALFGGEPSGARLLRVTTSRGPRAIACDDVRFVSIEAPSVHALTPVVGDAIRLPHVVGLLEHEERLYWLVDPRVI